MELELEQFIEKYNIIERTFKSIDYYLKCDPEFYHEIFDGYDEDKFEYVFDHAEYVISNFWEEPYIAVYILMKYENKSVYIYCDEYDLDGEGRDDWLIYSKYYRR